MEKQREIARNLLDVLNDQMIAKKCDLSLEEVKQLVRNSFEYSFLSEDEKQKYLEMI